MRRAAATALACGLLLTLTRMDLPAQRADLDARVEALLKKREGTWRDLNVPTADGRTLHRLIVENKYTRALEIGTSTGHSGLWIAWALSKTGGKLITLEIDPERHRQSVANFREAGLENYVDARLGDAHELVPNLVPGGMFTAHNVTMRGRGIGEFLEALKRLPDGETTFDNSSPAGLSITRKKTAK